MRRNLLTTLIVFFIVSVRVCSQGLIPLIQQSGKYFHKVTVHKGLTLTGIKSKFNVTEEQLKKANPSLTSALAIGQEVLVPARKETFNHKVVKGETMYSICQRYQITIDTLKAANRVLMNSDIK
ncbi:MAG: LysM peptidoglycan-binding domain-containing protein, partial [Flavobacteriales bacterium]